MKQQIGKLDAINSDLKAMTAKYSTLIQNSKESSPYSSNPNLAPAQQSNQLMDSLDQIILGNYTDKVTVGGTTTQIILGLFDLDLPMDVRDISYDLNNWKWSWGSAGQLGLDGVGLLPLIGALKYGGDVKTIVKDAVKACECFTAGTKVQTDQGEKPIEDIQVGDKVLSKDEVTGEVAYKEVTSTFNHVADAVYKIHVGGQVIEATFNHPFWVDGKGWTFVKDLQVGDLLVQSDGNKIKVDSIELEQKQVTVYNMTVADFHTYFVSNLGIWVHNSNCFEAGVSLTSGGHGFTQHGAEQASKRGYSAKQIDDIVDNYGNKYYQSGGRTAYAKKAKDGFHVVILNSDNEIISVVGGQGKNNTLNSIGDVEKMLNNQGGFSNLPILN